MDIDERRNYDLNQIIQLSWRYGMMADDKTAEGWIDLFAEDVRFTYQGGTRNSIVATSSGSGTGVPMHGRDTAQRLISWAMSSWISMIPIPTEQLAGPLGSPMFILRMG